jgi:hypothetical protein
MQDVIAFRNIKKPEVAVSSDLLERVSSGSPCGERVTVPRFTLCPSEAATTVPDIVLSLPSGTSISTLTSSPAPSVIGFASFLQKAPRL